jgi:hypothetical protein
MTPSEDPKALQASECSELLDPKRANCWICAQHQPDKFIVKLSGQNEQSCSNVTLVPNTGKGEAGTQCLESLVGDGSSEPPI